MSWDVIICDFKGSPVPIDEKPEDFQFPAIGGASEVREKISAHLPGVDWSDPAWGMYYGEGFGIEFNMGDEDIINDFMLHVRGGGDAIAAIMQFVRPNRWSALNTTLGEFLDPDNPSESGWRRWQAWRNKVV